MLLRYWFLRSHLRLSRSVAGNADEILERKRGMQLSDACASKHMKMAEPEGLAFDHSEEKKIYIRMLTHVCTCAPLAHTSVHVRKACSYKCARAQGLLIQVCTCARLAHTSVHVRKACS